MMPNSPKATSRDLMEMLDEVIFRDIAHTRSYGVQIQDNSRQGEDAPPSPSREYSLHGNAPGRMAALAGEVRLS